MPGATIITKKMACLQTESCIQDALMFILRVENISTKAELNLWCEKGGREKLYGYIKRMCSASSWNRLVDPKSYVRFYYQKALRGYKIYK